MTDVFWVALEKEVPKKKKKKLKQYISIPKEDAESMD